jgi:membrane protease YdiL (CAAX protease family)
MHEFLPWIRIIVVTLTFIFFAVLASRLIRKAGGNLKEMKNRTSRRILVVGTVANLSVLAVTLLFLKFIDGRQIAALGFMFSVKEMAFSTVGTVMTFTLAILFIGLLGYSSRFRVRLQKPLKNHAQLTGLGGSLFVLLVVAIQEEVLFRGYITLNLLLYGPVVVIIVSTILFSAIHLLTNRFSFYQILSWLLIGAFLSYAYLISGSIWVPIILHFAIDATNMVVFNIVGKYSIFKIIPAVTEQNRAIYRIVYTAALLTVLLVFYAPSIKLV